MTTIAWMFAIGPPICVHGDGRPARSDLMPLWQGELANRLVTRWLTLLARRSELHG